MPLQAIEMSGLPNMKYHRIIADAAPAHAARFVLIAMTEMRRSVAPSVEPGLKPIQPNSRMNVPVTTKTMLCAGNARGLPSRPYLPMRGPRMMASAMAAEAADGVHHGRAGEIDSSRARARMSCPSCDIQPPPQTQQPKIG